VVRALIWTVTTALVLYVAVTVLAWIFQRKLIYFPDQAAPPSAAEVIPGARDVTLRTTDGLELGAWLVPPSPPDRSMTVMVSNGNAGDRSGRAPLAKALAEAGFQVLLFDYRGYAGNPGSPSETGLALDVRAAYDYLVSEAGVRPDQLIAVGESLGAAVTTELAANRPVAGVVLRSPFSDLAAVGRDHYPFLPVGLLLKDEFPVEDLIGDVSAPVTVVYGSDDSAVSPTQSRAVADAAPTLVDVVEVPGADHNDDALVYGPALVNAVIDLAELDPGRRH
jgi:pimeloyl-ACP methyl ester carboxylesterase